MSVIFQTTPPSVRIHLLPKESQFISYRVDGFLTISAWMPDRFSTVNQQRAYNNDDFYADNCADCARNCSSFIENHWDEETDDVDWSEIPGGEEGHCNVYDDGYHGQDCPEGYVVGTRDRDINFDISNMVFEISITHLNGESERYTRKQDSAFLQAAKIVNGNIRSGIKLAASNVFGDDLHPGLICWGLNYPAQNLREMVLNYLETPFNNDLLNLTAFERNCNTIRREAAANSYTSNFHNKFLCDGEADALMIVDAEQDIPAFFTMLSAGFRSIVEAPHVMLVPLKECIFERDGSTYEGFKTISDAVDKNWYVSKTGLLVGQI
jgi:hypothetical protein